jgi:hypothetical protein
MKQSDAKFKKDEFVFADGKVRRIKAQPWHAGFTWMYLFEGDDQLSLGEMYLQKIDQEKYIAATKSFRIATCHDKSHNKCFQIEKWTQINLDSPEEGYVPVDFHRSEETAKTIAKQWIEIAVHEALCPIRFSWYWNSSVKVERRREIDRWYNSLSDEHREMIDTITYDVRHECEMENES